MDNWIKKVNQLPKNAPKMPKQWLKMLNKKLLKQISQKNTQIFGKKIVHKITPKLFPLEAIGNIGF